VFVCVCMCVYVCVRASLCVYGCVRVLSMCLRVYVSVCLSLISRFHR